MLAPYYETLDTKDVDELLQCFHQLWSSPHIPSIFTLLLHRWLFSEAVDRSQLLKYANVVADGAKPLRRWDVRRGETRFKPIFLYLTYEVTLNPKKIDSVTEDVCRVLVRYVVQSFLFYETRQKLPDLLERLPNVIKGVNPLELFMLENSKELEQISVESALLRYLEGLETMTMPRASKATSRAHQVFGSNFLGSGKLKSGAMRLKKKREASFNKFIDTAHSKSTPIAASFTFQGDD
eukprot:jgi/Pico_ML_1/53058/g3674.t1